MSKEPPEIRASDADRDATAERLREGFADGRLDNQDLQDRLDAVYKARTRAELVPLVRDLPGSGEGDPLAKTDQAGATGQHWAGRFDAKATSRSGIAVMGAFSRRGNWVVPRFFRSLVVGGAGEIDLREARFEAREVEIKATAIMGAIEITVPHDAEVEVTGQGIMGSFEQEATGAGVAGAPRVVVSGLAFWGSVQINRRRSSDESGSD